MTSRAFQNTSPIGAYTNRMFAELASAKQRAAEEQSKPAFPVEYTNPMFLAMQCFMQRQKWSNTLASANEDGDHVQVQWRQTYLGQSAHYSSTSLGELKPILLKDMKVRHHHEGQYLLCRVISPPSRMVCTSLAVEDPKGWAQLVSLYNYPGTYFANGAELDTLFPLNTVIVIREPSLKMALVASHSHIRVDSPTDIVVVKYGDAVLRNIEWTTGERPFPVYTKTANEWKAIADKHFKAKEYYAAIAGYSFALQRDPSTVSVRLNRSLANLRAGRNLQAIEDAREVLSREQMSSTDRVKALYRCAQGMYGEGRYSDAKKWYSKCIAVDPTLKDAVVGVQRCDSRMKEKSSGIYDWEAMYKPQSLDSFSNIDISDFTGPVEKSMMNHRGGGRGIIASRDISAGELLVVSKPFAFADPSVDSTQGIFFAMDFLTNRIQNESQYILIQRAISRAASNPRDAVTLLDLYAGPQHGLGPVGSTLGQSGRHKNGRPAAYDLDSSKIEAICLLNSFGCGMRHETEEVSAITKDTPTALYILPSYFNHSCLPNASRENMGCVMVMRATTSIKKGEEITISYCQPGISYEMRTKTLKMWLERCDCTLCEQDRKNGALKRNKRKQLLDEIRRSHHTIEKLRSISKEMDSTYSVDYGNFRPDSAAAHEAVAAELERLAMRNIDKGTTRSRTSLFVIDSIQETFKGFAAMGLRVVDMKTDEVTSPRGLSLPISTEWIPYDTSAFMILCFRVVERLFLLGNVRRAEMWMRAAMWCDSVWNGDEVESFRRRRREALNGLGEYADVLINKIAQSKVDL